MGTSFCGYFIGDDDDHDQKPLKTIGILEQCHGMSRDVTGAQIWTP